MLFASPDLATSLSDHPAAGLVAVYLGGVLTSLTPCLYPMIPVTVSIVGGAAGATRRSSRMSLAATYVLGLASAYAALGVIAGLTGTLFGAISTNPWLLFAMANVMLVAALAMADVVPVPIPQRWRDRSATMGEGGRHAGVLVMGLVSGLVAAPCGAFCTCWSSRWACRRCCSCSPFSPTRRFDCPAPAHGCSGSSAPSPSSCSASPSTISSRWDRC